MAKQTPLYGAHEAAGAKFVDFAGWTMPLHYGSQLDEHRAVREHCGIFDVSHMGSVDIEGAQAEAFLRRLLANDVAKLSDGKALYSCLLNQAGGVLDDLIVYLRRTGEYRLVVNAATREADVDWFNEQLGDEAVTIKPRPDLAMLALQGPAAADLLASALPLELAAAARRLSPFCSIERDGYFIGRTGYTGEDGFELIMASESAQACWSAWIAAGVAPCGLGARDSLRLEAGLNLYGQDMDTDTTPLESGLGWTVSWGPEERDFIGREALLTQRESGVKRRLVGLVLEARGVMRAGQPVYLDGGQGTVTSGGFSPILGCSIALARIPAGAVTQACEIELRGRRLPARIVKPPFVRYGKAKV
ncbi:glycine cleavage system protein T [Alkalilimnicola ehrlichii]|uniref:Aminomethyltransferase n=1 Tax=Alkalilimnicola ehrlichii TaxID=351052 RepID=A0A3E0X1D4_9GAMM|nr:glycine cleavage system aminomethyltransferase GcvT [Alkalilimnicola ehrlichii]RFA31261.1 glycine cleavage system protein T [Alkalilimnicola ehrlichii]RFA39463.1 glycine cleavage system protein T [Alkalilimnicola ehrlichii]